MNPLDARRRLLGRNVYKRTTEGNPAIAQGSLARRYPGIGMQGWTEQAQYEGNQLFDESLISDLSGVGIFRFPIYVGEGTFTLSSDCPYVGGWANVFFQSGNPSSGESSKDNGVYPGRNVTVNSVNGYVTVSVRAVSDDGANTYNPKDYNIMLNEGSTALPYEPYTGCAPSPSPDYPQEIMSEGKYNEESQEYEYGVKLTGANLFDPDGESVNGTYIGFPLHNKGVVSLILYEKNPDIDISSINFGFTTNGVNGDNGANWIIIGGACSGDAISYSLDNAYISVYPKNKLETVLERYDVMVNYGTEPLPYQPYKEQTVTITSDRPLTKWDKLEKRKGQWGWVYKSAEIVLDGSADEHWMLQADSKGKIQFYITLYDALFPYSKPFTEMFYCDTFLTTNNLGTIPNWQIRKGTYNGLAPVFKPSDDIDTVDLFRAFLAENPTTILYATTEETFVPLSSSEQAAMNALYTFRPTTVLSNDCECEMSLTYKTKKSLEVTT